MIAGQFGPTSTSTIAVVGASGWIGEAVVQELAERGHRVLAVSRRDPDRFHDQVVWRQVSRHTNAREMAMALDGANTVINAAGAAHVTNGRMDKDTAFANEELPEVIGMAIVRANIPRLVHLSSIKALGEGGPAPLRASDAPNPTTVYGLSKLAGEYAVQRATARTGVALTIVRPPMVYGPGAPANFARLARLASSPFPVPLPMPYPWRSLTYLGNLAALLAHLGQKRKSADIVHIADTPHLTTRDLVRHASQAAAAPDRIVPLPAPFVRALLTLAGRREDYLRLSRDLIVEPSQGRDIANWVPPFPDHQGFWHTAASQ